MLMDTPERNNNNTPLSNEGSPVFNYINSLSPLKPVKSVHVTQTFTPLSFSSPPSVFTSPHVNFIKESRFLRRHNLVGTPKPKVSFEDVTKIYSCEVTPSDSTHACHDSNVPQENTDQRICVGDSSTKPPSEYTRFSFGFREAFKNNSGSHGFDPRLCSDKANSLFELPGEPTPDVACVQQGPKKDSVEGGVHIQGVCHMEERDNLITDASNLLIFSSPNASEALKGLMNKQLDPSFELSNFMTLLPRSTTNNGGRMQTVNLAASGSEREIEYHPTGPITGQAQNNLANVASMTSNPREKMNDELLYVTRRGMRRCLDYEMSSVQRMNSGGSSNISYSTVKSERDVGNEKPLLPTKPTCDSQRYLNAFAAINDYESVKSEMMSSQMQPSFPSSTSSMLLSSRQERHLSLVPASMEKDLEPSEDEVQPAEDCTQSPPVYMADEDIHQNIPKKKRRKLEPAGEGESCKRCNCKKSKCLKLYCECFAAGVYCTEPCMCLNCFNQPIHEDVVIKARQQIESRNPLAFAPKVIRSSDSTPEIRDDLNKTPASARHKRGCNCKKSSCLKKYCECYQGGVGCSINCRCEGCKNAYGRKDGSAPTEMEAEPEEETNASEKSAVGKPSLKTEIQDTEDQSDYALPTSPLHLSRRLLPLPFSSKGNPPRGPFIATISASGLIASEKLRKPNALQSQAKFEKPLQTAPDDDDSSNTCIKTSSPNGKRISSPNCEFGSPPTRRGSRKLILQSISSFPSLAPPN